MAGSAIFYGDSPDWVIATEIRRAFDGRELTPFQSQLLDVIVANAAEIFGMADE